MGEQHYSGPSGEPYAEPRVVTDVDDCLFYHTMDVPGHGVVEGQWDLRPGIGKYLGGIDFGGKRVLELGTASGFVCFHLEGQGADVVAYDLSDKDSWDIVPYAGLDVEAMRRAVSQNIRKLNNAWWFCHRALGSRAKVVYGSIYEVPASVGPVDAAVYSAVLVHVRDPFRALQSGLRLTRHEAVVSDMLIDEPPDDAEGRPTAQFIPDYTRQNPADAWWFLNPKIIRSWLGVLGFEDTEVTYHRQGGTVAGEQRFFTVVGRRTKGTAEGA